MVNIANIESKTFYHILGNKIGKFKFEGSNAFFFLKLKIGFRQVFKLCADFRLDGPAPL